jgi:glutathione S-transferase
MIKIYNFPRGLRGVRVFWVCEEMGLPYQTEAVTFPQSADYRARHALGFVPYLEDEGGIAINESVAMMLYLAQKYGPTPLLPAKDDPSLARVMQMTVFSETTLGAGINTLLIAHFMAPDAEKQNWSIKAQEPRVVQAIDYAANMLGDAPYFAGNTFTLADIAISTSLGIWQGALKKPIPDKLVAFRERLSERPAYQRALKAQQ